MSSTPAPRRRGANQVTGNAGLFFVSYRLSCLGWNVLLTSRNTRGVDIPSGDRSNPASRGRVKTGHPSRGLVRVYRTDSSGIKSEAVFVRQLRGPHLSTCA